MIRLGIDIGGTGIKGAPVNTETGELTGERFRIPTPHPAKPDEVVEVVADVAEHFSTEGPLGVTFPGVVRDGVITTAVNLEDSWVDLEADKFFSGHLRRPVKVINDADAAGLAEVHFGAGQGRRGVVILLTLGTGIGSAIFVDGKLLPNSEFGHLQIRGKDAEKRASEKIREDKDLSWKKWAKALSEFLNALETLFSPDLFIIGGGVSKKADKFIPHLKLKTGVEVVPAKMRNEAGIIGAASIAHES